MRIAISALGSPSWGSTSSPVSPHLTPHMSFLIHKYVNQRNQGSLSIPPPSPPSPAAILRDPFHDVPLPPVCASHPPSSLTQRRHPPLPHFLLFLTYSAHPIPAAQRTDQDTQITMSEFVSTWRSQTECFERIGRRERRRWS